MKKIHFYEKKKLTMNVDSAGDESIAFKCYEKWMDTFHRLMLKQISDVSIDGEKWLRISNHLHMQVNRFFPFERQEMENWVYLQLYKDFGKKMFRA